MLDAPEGVYANIHHYFTDPESGAVNLDEFEEPMIGFYFQIMGVDGPISFLMGPYPTFEEAQEKAVTSWDNNTYEPFKPSNLM